MNSHQNVSEVMTHLVVTCRPEDTLRATARRLQANRISGAPVVSEGKIVGLISETDLLRACLPRRRSSKLVPLDPFVFFLDGGEVGDEHPQTVAEVMTQRVVTTSPDASLREAAVLLDKHGVRRLPVVDEEGFVVGVVTRSDLVRAMAQNGAWTPAEVG